jgi:sigma-B regulation protein RsbU (phosphoserine phosphatase)
MYNIKNMIKTIQYLNFSLLVLLAILTYINPSLRLFVIPFLIYTLLIHWYLKKDAQKVAHSTSQTQALRELEIAKKVQEALLAIEPPHIEGIKIAKRCLPAKTLGGDFYTFINKDIQSLIQKPKIPGVIEYIDSNERYLGIAIGDVAGHGVSSALVMALSSGIVDKIGQNNKSPAITLQKANEDIRKYIETTQIGYVTLFYSTLNIETKTLVYSKAGHVPALLAHQDGDIQELHAKGIFLGLYPNEKYEQKTCQLSSKDRIIYYTDGITESRSPSGELFGLERLKSLIKANQKKSVGSLVDIIFKNVLQFTEKKQAKDDQTIVILEIE